MATIQTISGFSAKYDNSGCDLQITYIERRGKNNKT